MDTLTIQFNGARALAVVFGRLKALPFRITISTVDVINVVVENKKENDRCYLTLEDEGGREVVSGNTLSIDYRGVQQAKMVVLAIIKDEEDAVIDLDFGYVLSKAEMLSRAKADPAWDWRAQPIWDEDE